MKKLLVTILFAGLMLSSCMNDKFGSGAAGSGKEQEVEIVLFDMGTTRATTPGVADERVVETLDLLIFKNNGFQYWRRAYQINGNYRAVLHVDTGLDVVFLANSRNTVEELLPTDAAIATHQGDSWEELWELLIDTDPERLVPPTGFTYLPMWSILKNQKVEDLKLNLWAPVKLIRSVASVDVIVNDTITNFKLQNLSLCYAPDCGYLGISESNYNSTDNEVFEAESPPSMLSSKTLFTDRYDENTKSIANKMYMYDNDVTQATATQTRRQTRLVLGGSYKDGETTYYPLDFESGNQLATVKSNWKYVFMIDACRGRGFTDPGTAATQPPVALTVTVVNWNDNTTGDFGVSWPYYVWLEKRVVTLPRPAASVRYVNVTSNMLSEVISINFEDNHNGAQSAVSGSTAGMDGDGIENTCFRVEKITDSNGYIKQFKVTALENFDYADATKNTDKVILVAGRIQFDITINQLDQDDADWQDGGEIDTDL